MQASERFAATWVVVDVHTGHQIMRLRFACEVVEHHLETIRRDLEALTVGAFCVEWGIPEPT